MQYSWPGVISKNLVVGFVVALLYTLILWPIQIRKQIQAPQDYPKDLIIFYSEPFANQYASSKQDKLEAAQKLNELLEKQRLAVESSLLEDAKKIPKIYISQSMFSLGLLRLIDGEVTKDGLIAQQGGPYNTGDITTEGMITALLEVKWNPLFVTDAVIFKTPSNYLDSLPGILRETTKFYLSSISSDQIQQVLQLIQIYTGKIYNVLPLYEYLARDIYALEIRQVNLQKLALAFLLICLLLTLYSDLSRIWFEKREIYRIERLLGRSRTYFFKAWLRNQWIWGLLLSTSIFSFLTLRDLPHSIAGFKQLIFWFLGVLSTGLVMSIGFALTAIRFPLARSTLDTEKTWQDHIVPVLITFCLVFGITYLFADTFTQWLEGNQSVKSLGANQVIALTTSAAQQKPPEDLCLIVQTSGCVPFGISRAYLWPPELFSLADQEGFDTLLQVSPQYAEDLRVSLVEGRLPQNRTREAAINESALEKIRSLAPGFGIGSTMEIGYKVVGIFKTPLEAKYAVFESIYKSATLIADNAPDMHTEFFLPPLGKWGLVLTIDEKTNLQRLKQETRNKYQDLEFIQPATYAQGLTLVIKRSLIKLIGVFLLAGALAIYTYRNLTSTILVKRTLELSIWRLLGMNVTTLQLHLQRSLLPIMFVSGFLGVILGYLFLYAVHRTEVIPYAIACGIGVILLFTLIILTLLYNKVKSMVHREISETYKEAL